MKNQHDKIEYLKQYKDISKELERLIEKHDDFKDKFESIMSPIITDMPTMTTYAKDKMDRGLMQKEKLNESIGDTIFELFCKKLDIFNVINSLSSSTHREIMRLRYLEGYKWDEVCVELNYSWKHTHRLHSEALELIIIKDDTQ